MFVNFFVCAVQPVKTEVVSPEKFCSTVSFAPESIEFYFFRMISIMWDWIFWGLREWEKNKKIIFKKKRATIVGIILQCQRKKISPLECLIITSKLHKYRLRWSVLMVNLLTEREKWLIILSQFATWFSHILLRPPYNFVEPWCERSNRICEAPQMDKPPKNLAIDSWL